MVGLLKSLRIIEVSGKQLKQGVTTLEYITARVVNAPQMHRGAVDAVRFRKPDAGEIRGKI
jgi:hypothetical protein